MWWEFSIFFLGPVAVVVVRFPVLPPTWTSIGWILLKFGVDPTHWGRPGPGAGVLISGQMSGRGARWAAPPAVQLCSIKFSLRTRGVESLLLIILLLCSHIVALFVAIGGAHQRGEREVPCEGGGSVGRQWTGFGASICSVERKIGIHIVPGVMGQYGYAWFCSFREKRSLDGSRVRKQSLPQNSTQHNTTH